MQIKGTDSSVHPREESTGLREANVYLTPLLYTFLLLFSQGQPPLDLPPDREDCSLGEQILATEQSMISMPGQGRAHCHFLLISFL